MKSRTMLILIAAMAGTVAPARAQAVAPRAAEPPATAEPADLPEIATVPPVPDLPWPVAQETAESLNRQGREALNQGRYQEAANLFARVYSQYYRSPQAGDAFYWEAFARYRIGTAAQLRSALRTLERQEREFPSAATRADARQLATQISGALARRGDAEQAERIAEAAARAADAPVATPAPSPGVSPAPRPGRTPRPPQTPRPPRSARGRSEPVPGCPAEEEDERIAALNALLQMDADLAMPILQRVLQRREPCSELLRRKAVFLVAQKHSAESASILLEAAKSDPDAEVRQNAVFWLGQVRDERAVDILEELLRTSEDPDMQDRAIFALSQHRSERAGAALRAFTARNDAPVELREKAIFWLAQHRSSENPAFLRELYPKLTDESLKERVIYALSQSRDASNATWLLRIAQSASEPIEMRKKALFWGGQMREVPVAELTALYDKVPDREMKEQLIFVYSQRKDTGAVDKLMEIARRDSDAELRRKAIFWLSQTRDPRAAAFLEELIIR